MFTYPLNATVDLQYNVTKVWMNGTVNYTAPWIGDFQNVLQVIMPSPHTIAQGLLHSPSSLPPLVTLEIYPTLRCNLDCLFCDTTERHRPPQAELSLEKWLSIVDEAADMGAKQIFVLGGGEPFIYPGLMTILSRAKERGLWGMLTTNGTFFTAERRQQLIEIGWDEIHISLDGATQDTHDTLRGQRGTFQKVIQSICHFRAEKSCVQVQTPDLIVHWVITNKNFQEIPDIIKLAKSLGISRVDFDGLIAYTPEQQSLCLRPQEQQRFKDVALASIRLAKRLGIQTTLEHHLGSQRGVHSPPSGQQPGLLGAPCYKPWHHLTIQADGRISPCCVLAGQGESIREQALRTCWQESPYLNTLRQQMLDHSPGPRCKECSPNILSQEWAIQRALIELTDTEHNNT